MIRKVSTYLESSAFNKWFFYLQEKEFIEPAKEIVLNRARNEYSTDMKIDSMQEKLEKSENEIIRLNSKIDEILNLLKRDDN